MCVCVATPRGRARPATPKLCDPAVTNSQSVPVSAAALVPAPHNLGASAAKAPRHAASGHGRAPVVGVGGSGAGGRGRGRDGIGYGVEKGGALVWYDCVRLAASGVTRFCPMVREEETVSWAGRGSSGECLSPFLLFLAA